jgi:hypothetical protein
VVVSLSVAKYEDRERAGSDGKAPRETPGTRARAQGSAELKLVPAGREFWKSPKGVAIIGGAVVAILILSSGHGGSGSTTSSSAQ